MVLVPIRIAIVGGGLAGTILMNSLIKYPHLDVHVYEANSEFKERGASVGLSTNAQRALRLLGLGDVMKSSNGVQVSGTRLIRFSPSWTSTISGAGPDAGKKVLDHEAELTALHRAALLGELIKPLPKDRLHFSKRLRTIEGSTIHFEDGSVVTADLIISADKIHSVVRKFLLGEGHSAVEPVFAGFWDTRTVVPLEQAAEAIGTKFIDKADPQQHMHVADGCMIFHDIIDDGRFVCVIVGGRVPSDWDQTQWKQTMSRKQMDVLFKDWENVAPAALDMIFGDKTEMSTFVQWESAKAPKLYDGPLCMIGDAAHATTPWQGSSLALAIEDCLILKTVLGECGSAQDVPAALKAYDQVMRPRGEQIIDSSRRTGMILLGAEGFDFEHLANTVPHRWDFIFDWDTEKAMAEAVEIFEKSKSVD